MAITKTLQYSAAAAITNQTSSTTGAFSIDAGRLAICTINFCSTGTPTSDPTVVDSNSVAWTLVAKVVDYSVTAGTVRHHSLYVYSHYYASAQASIGLTATWNATGRVVAEAVIQWNPSASETLEVKQSNTASGTGSSLSVGEASAFADATNNVTFAAMATGGSTNSAITPEHTEIYAGNNASIVATDRQNLSNQWVVGEDATVTGTGNGDPWGAIFLEIGAAAGGGGGATQRNMMLMGVGA